MNITQFFLQWNGKYLDADGAYGYECVDPIKQYFKDVLGLPPFQGNAIDYWNKTVPGFDQIPNSWVSWPQPGDIIVWNTNVGQYGHIAICNWSRAFDMGVFEQNWPLGKPCQYRDTNYKNVVGWLRPRPSAAPKQIQVAFLGLKSAPRQDFIAQVGRFTSGQFACVINDYSASPCQFTTDAATALLDKVNPKEQYVFIETMPGVAFDKASFYPAKNQAFALVMPNEPTSTYLHEFLHLLRKHINFNGIKPYIEDVECYPTTWADAGNVDNVGWKFQTQYQQLLPYKNSL